MKNLWKTWDKRPVKIFITICLLFGIGGLPCMAENRNEDLDSLTFVEMVNSVDVSDFSKVIQDWQELEAKRNLLKKYNDKAGCSVLTYRNKEVLLITIPAEDLFDPNETLLKAKADEFLNPIKRYLNKPDFFRVLLAMHTDNTGSSQYRDDITDERVESIFEWFYDKGCDTSFLFPYAMGDDVPLFPDNDSMENRAKNRRLEIYLMPGTKMLEQAKKGIIEF